MLQCLLPRPGCQITARHGWQGQAGQDEYLSARQLATGQSVPSDEADQ